MLWKQWNRLLYNRIHWIIKMTSAFKQRSFFISYSPLTQPQFNVMSYPIHQYRFYYILTSWETHLTPNSSWESLARFYGHNHCSIKWTTSNLLICFPCNFYWTGLNKIHFNYLKHLFLALHDSALTPQLSSISLNSSYQCPELTKNLSPCKKNRHIPRREKQLYCWFTNQWKYGIALEYKRA